MVEVVSGVGMVVGVGRAGSMGNAVVSCEQWRRC